MIPRYSRTEMSQLWSDESKYQLWLEVELLVAEACAENGLFGIGSYENMRRTAKFSLERIQEIEQETKHEVIAFLTNISENIGPDGLYLHYGMTSSDLLDTAFAVQLCSATDLILKVLDELMQIIKFKAMQYRNTVCVGRTHGIHAEPTTFGLKLAGWFAELERQKHRIELAREDIAVGAISGPVGTYAYLQPQIEESVCAKLHLKPDPISTQIVLRDRHASLFLAFAQLACSIERVMLEIRHLQRTEVREVEEPFSKGQKGSSAMPHKRNPILCENITGLARLIRAWASAAFENVALWHERDISHSSVERVIAPDITVTLDFMLARVVGVIRDLQVYPENMQKNLDLTGGLIYSGKLLLELTTAGMPRDKAYALVQKHALDTWEVQNSAQAFNSGDTFILRIKNDPEIVNLIGNARLDQIFTVESYLKNVDFIFGRVFGA